MNWKDAMKKCREGEAVRHPEMNVRWTLVNSPEDVVVQVSTTGAQLEYRPSERDRLRTDWHVE